MHAQFFGGYWQLSRRAICLNEGGFVLGLTVSMSLDFFDAWFKLPFRGARSFRITRVSGCGWRVGKF
jgi:hypothetical protein